jgi:histidinol-phosphate aminotransferase
LASLGIHPADVIDFSASINPLGTSKRVLEAVQDVNLASYPDPECVSLREALGETLGVKPSNILPGNGSTELIHLLARAFLAPDDSAVIFAPTFGEYVAACRTQGVEPEPIGSPHTEIGPEQFRWDLTAAVQRISELSPSLVFLCNPNNPTGVYLPEQEIRRVVEAMQGVGIVILDEAYVSFVEDPWDSTQLIALGNVAVLRSMTKDHALTGLRLGYLLATEEIISKVRRFQYSWSVNSPAQTAGIAALSDSEHVRRGREAVLEGKAFLTGVADSLGLECVPGAANFLLLKVGRASEVRLALLKEHRICVRDCASFGLPEYIRVGIRTMDDNRKLAEALKQVLAPRGAVA